MKKGLTVLLVGLLVCLFVGCATMGEAETGINSTMFIDFEFTKAMVSGIGKTGNCRPEASMRVTIKNIQGQTIRLKTYRAGSDGNAKVSSGVYSQSEMMNLLQEAITNVCYNFLDDLEK
jgi:hypothetical protein